MGKTTTNTTILTQRRDASTSSDGSGGSDNHQILPFRHKITLPLELVREIILQTGTSCPACLSKMHIIFAHCLLNWKTKWTGIIHYDFHGPALSCAEQWVSKSDPLPIGMAIWVPQEAGREAIKFTRFFSEVKARIKFLALSTNARLLDIVFSNILNKLVVLEELYLSISTTTPHSKPLDLSMSPLLHTVQLWGDFVNPFTQQIMVVLPWSKLEVLRLMSDYMDMNMALDVLVHCPNLRQCAIFPGISTSPRENGIPLAPSRILKTFSRMTVLTIVALYDVYHLVSPHVLPALRELVIELHDRDVRAFSSRGPEHVLALEAGLRSLSQLTFLYIEFNLEAVNNVLENVFPQFPQLEVLCIITHLKTVTVGMLVHLTRQGLLPSLGELYVEGRMFDFVVEEKEAVHALWTSRQPILKCFKVVDDDRELSFGSFDKCRHQVYTSLGPLSEKYRCPRPINPQLAKELQFPRDSCGCLYPEL